MTVMDRAAQGWVNGLAGVAIFSGSLPATRVAVAGFSPIFLTAARAVIAAALAATMLSLWRQARPHRREIVPLAIVAGGVVVGFPLLTALALRYVTSAHSIVFIGFLPLSTAIFGVLRGGERLRPRFWLFSALGGAVIAAFAIANGGRASMAGDLLMLAAVVVCGLGYAEGAALSRRLGGWQVISWALLLASPPMALVALSTFPLTLRGIDARAWMGLAYVSVFSMLIGFVFWYRGLALGGIAKVGQLQLLQPFLGLLLAAWLLDEAVSATMIGATIIVIACVVMARRYA